jgi:hypothetical protein
VPLTPSRDAVDFDNAGAAILAMKYEVGIAFQKMNESIDRIASVIGIKLDSQPRRVDRNSQTSLREPLAD